MLPIVFCKSRENSELITCVFNAHVSCSLCRPTSTIQVYRCVGVVQFPPPPSTVMDRVTDRVRDRVRDRDMGRVRDRARLRGLAIAAPSYSGP